VKRVLLLGLCLVVVLPVATALAGKKHKKKVPKLGPVLTTTASGNVATSSNLESTATAACPAGTRAVGGGFAAPFAPGSALVVHDSFRSSPTTWTVSGTVVDGIGVVDAYAYCRKTKGHPITDASASIAFTETGEIHAIDASCPSGKLIGGGFQATTIPGDEAVIFPVANDSGLAKTTWTVVGVANQDGRRVLTAHAYCMAQVRAPTFADGYSTETVGLFGAVSSTATCLTAKPLKKGKKRRRKPIYAGGFSTSPVNRTPDFPSMIFTESRRTPIGGWVASATNRFNATAGVSVLSRGYCL
jgi:hypothetical protein